MKKSLFAIMSCSLMLLCCCFLFGCNETVEKIGQFVEGFSTAACVSFLDENGDMNSLDSYYAFDTEKVETSQSEYDSSTAEIKEPVSRVDMDANKTLDYAQNTSYKYFSSSENKYILWSITEITEHFVQVKVHSNGNLEIIDAQGERFEIKTSYYKITYFN